MKYLKSAGHQTPENYPILHRRSLVMLLGLAAICMGLALGGCDLRKVDASAETNSKKDSNMDSLQANTSLENKIPPIDEAVARETETATFALG
jgi:hypothetical protein